MSSRKIENRDAHPVRRDNMDCFDTRFPNIFRAVVLIVLLDSAKMVKKNVHDMLH